ncbi:MAG TPA: bifunctional D-glycero-beta-D-manno-heptose-7-phosphate kinase/D-glycero-beta-D-manno-heptose 1-phosphate adenylyltransferase HldE [Cellvibrionaceae bacterium]
MSISPPCPDFKRARVLVVGDVMLDRYWQGDTRRVSPEAPVPVVSITSTEDRAGGAGNVALNLTALGARVSLVGVIGADEAGDLLRQSLESSGIHTDFQVAEGKPTITKLRVISRHQQLLRLDIEQPYNPDDAADITGKAVALMSGMDALILSDYAKGSLQDCQLLIKRAGELGIPVLVDPKGHDFSRYRGATLLTPNRQELEAVIGPVGSDQQLLERAAQLMQELQLGALLITRGEQGMTLLRAESPVLHLPAAARDVYDVTGAGDTVIALMAACLAVGVALPEATNFANLAAGLVVGKLGAATVTPQELNRVLATGVQHSSGVVNREQLSALVTEARAQGERIVFTNGCFDILHAGHVRYLAEAKRQGDRLIVAINSDDSVSKLKGPTRPINPLAQRMTVIAALADVDWVVDFAEDTPVALLEEIRPAVLVKGGDYTLDQVVGREWVESYGGEVIVVPMVDGCSSSNMIEKILQDRK